MITVAEHLSSISSTFGTYSTEYVLTNPSAPDLYLYLEQRSLNMSAFILSESCIHTTAAGARKSAHSRTWYQKATKNIQANKHFRKGNKKCKFVLATTGIYFKHNAPVCSILHIQVLLSKGYRLINQLVPYLHRPQLHCIYDCIYICLDISTKYISLLINILTCTEKCITHS